MPASASPAPATGGVTFTIAGSTGGVFAQAENASETSKKRMRMALRYPRFLPRWKARRGRSRLATREFPSKVPGAMAKKAKPSKQRRERIFEPLAAGNKVLVMILGALGALAMGAGV